MYNNNNNNVIFKKTTKLTFVCRVISSDLITRIYNNLQFFIYQQLILAHN